ncbi:MAG: kdpD [Verrucomicrobiales bacterium]|nr:kdpD [Verrucomicrobiales bacterium]
MRAMEIEGPSKTGHRLLVVVTVSPFSQQTIRWAHRLAESWNCPWIAVHVGTASSPSDVEQTNLTENLALARELGAEVITTADEDVVRGILRIVRQHDITQIVVGKGMEPNSRVLFWRASFLGRLIRQSAGIAVHIVNPEKHQNSKGLRFHRPLVISWRSYLLTVSVIGLVTYANHVFSPAIGYRAVALNYLLSIVLLAFFVGRGPMLFAATISALVWNYLFLPPRFTFSISHFEDAMMFGMYFVLAIVLGQLIARIRIQEKAERRREEQSTALYLLTRDLAEASSLDDVVQKFLQHVQDIFKGEAALILGESSKTLSKQPHPTSKLQLSEHEMNTATWVFTQRQTQGPFTDTAKVSFLPLTTAKEKIGVLAIKLNQSVANVMDYQNLLEAFTRQAALVIDRQRLQEYAEKNRLFAESERLGKNLLDSISHEMRTPIAAITTAVSSLSDSNDPGSVEMQHELKDEIQIATHRLNRLVGNLLDIARVESGHLRPKVDWCEIADLIHVTLKSLEKEMAAHKIRINLDAELPLVEMDFVLMEQALTNLLLNAVHHTPPGTAVELSAKIRDNELAISVADSGRGLPVETLERVFEKFYRVPGSPSGGTGLGLSIVKGFVEAQRGRVTVANRPESGAIFTIYLPTSEPPPISFSRE